MWNRPSCQFVHPNAGGQGEESGPGRDPPVSLLGSRTVSSGLKLQTRPVPVPHRAASLGRLFSLAVPRPRFRAKLPGNLPQRPRTQNVGRNHVPGLRQEAELLKSQQESLTLKSTCPAAREAPSSRQSAQKAGANMPRPWHLYTRTTREAGPARSVPHP